MALSGSQRLVGESLVYCSNCDSPIFHRSNVENVCQRCVKKIGVF